MNAEKRLRELLMLRNEVDGEIRRVERRIKDAAENRTLRPIRKVAECGTDGGYFRHLRQTRTKPCAECREAHNLKELARRRLRKIRQEEAS